VFEKYQKEKYVELKQRILADPAGRVIGLDAAFGNRFSSRGSRSHPEVRD
jgi:hypothetical protein